MIPGLSPAFARIFLQFSHTIDLKIGTPVATLPGAQCYRVSAGTGQPGVSILWLGEIESLVCNFYLSVAACTLVWSDPFLRYTRIKRPTNKQARTHWFVTYWWNICDWIRMSEVAECLTSLTISVWLQAYTSQFISLVMIGLMFCEDRISMQERRREIIQGLRALPGEISVLWLCSALQLCIALFFSISNFSSALICGVLYLKSS